MALRISFGRNLSDFCAITVAVCESVGTALGTSNAFDLLEQAWTEAYDQNSYRRHNDEVLFQFPHEADGATRWVEVTLRKNEPGNPKEYRTQAARLLDAPPRAYENINDFAYVRPQMYEQLANMALPEPWSFTGNGLDLLKFYLNGTFLHLLDEGKIAKDYDTEGKFCVFCTGLVTPHYEDIYCFCVPNTNPGMQDWFVLGFCTLGSGHSGQRMRRAFGSNPPQRANYFPSMDRALYNGELDLVLDYSHILQRVHRISVPALRVLLRSSREAMAVLDRCEAAPVASREGILKELNPIVANSPVLQRSLHAAIERAAETARARARYMYTSVLPAWNPNQSSAAHFCIPLCLDVEERVDTVLIARLVDDQGEPYYEGKTIYDIKLAYKHARTVQRTDGLSGWISRAFEPDEPVSGIGAGGAGGGLSSFASPAFAVTPPQVRPNRASTPVNDAAEHAVMAAQLIPVNSELASFEVTSGNTIGLLRRPDDVCPDIELPAIGGFNAVSQIHGRFDCRIGQWVFEHLGHNPTRIRHLDGTAVTLKEKGDTELLAYGDEITFAESPVYLFER